jgi:putative endonuclease
MSTDLGQAAETLAADYLRRLGFKIVDRNWRTRFCEIDLIARDQRGIVRFIEVKYRRSAAFGHAVDYVTADKAGRLRRAAAAWMAAAGVSGDYRIDVVTVEGDLAADPRLTYLPNAITD